MSHLGLAGKSSLLRSFGAFPPPFFITPWITISLFSPLVNDRHDEQPRLLARQNAMEVSWCWYWLTATETAIS